MSYEHHRKFFDILMNSFSGLPDEEKASRRFKYLAETTVLPYFFGGLYNTLVQKKEMKSFHDQPKEYQDELWGIANEFLPNKPVEEQYKFIQVIMAVLWLNNN